MSGRSVALFAVVGIPTLLYLGVPLGERKEYKSRMYAQEQAALKNLQTLNTAQVQYYSQFGRYARSLAELGPPASGDDNAAAANLVPADLAAGERHGYKFTLAGTPQNYSIQAVPTVFGSTGSRTFTPTNRRSSARTTARGPLRPAASRCEAALERPATGRRDRHLRAPLSRKPHVCLQVPPRIRPGDIRPQGDSDPQHRTSAIQFQFGRYARSLTELGPSAADLIPADLSAGEKQGYKFTLTGTPTGYSIQAVPTAFGSTGSRTFYSDQSLIICENFGPQPATADSKEVGSVVVRAGATK
jgi:type IV pilus assembly protein PilA